MNLVSDGRVSPRTLSPGSISNSIFRTRSTRPNSQSPFRFPLSILQTKDAFGRLDVHQITRTSLPVRVYVDKRGSERGVLGILHRAPTLLDNGVIRGAANRDTHLDFDQHNVGRFRVVGR